MHGFVEIVAEITSGHNNRVRPPGYQGLTVKAHSAEVVNWSQRRVKASGQSSSGQGSLYWESPNLGRLPLGFGVLTTVTGA